MKVGIVYDYINKKICSIILPLIAVCVCGCILEGVSGSDPFLYGSYYLVPAEQIPRIHLLLHVAQHIRIEAVGQDNVALALKALEVVYDFGAEELGTVLQRGLVDDNGNALGLNALHNALDGGGAEVVGVALHRKPVDADGLRVARDDRIHDKVLAGGVALNDGFDQVLRHILVVGQQLLGVFGQAVAAVAEAGVVVVGADARVHAHAVDDLLRVEALHLRVGVQLVKVGDAHVQVGVGEELNGFGFRGMGDEDGNVLVFCAFLQELGEHFGLGLLMIVGADDDAAGVQVVVERLGFAQEFRAEDDVVDAVFIADGVGVADGDGAFDDHQHLRIEAQHVLDGVLHRGGIEELAYVVVVGGGSDDHQLGLLVGLVFVGRGGEVERALARFRLCEEAFDLVVLDGRDEVVQLLGLGRGGGDCGNFVMLRQQDCERQSDVADAGGNDLYGRLTPFILSDWLIDLTIKNRSAGWALCVF